MVFLRATEEELRATGLSERFLNTYRLSYEADPPLDTTVAGRNELAARLGLRPATVKAHLARVRRKLENPAALRRLNTDQKQAIDEDQYAEAIVDLSVPQRNIAATARKVGLSPRAATKIAKELDTEMVSLQREIVDVRLEELMRRFGTLTRDALDAITEAKLKGSSAKDLAVISGIGAQNWQLLRGQPTQRMEIQDRREMNEVLKLILEEVKRRGMEIDVTPEGGFSIQKKFPHVGRKKKGSAGEAMAAGEMVPA